MSKPKLSREKIVSEAIRFADDEGLDAVTLRRLAAKMNVHVTSLYNHVPTKQDLFTEMMKELVANSGMPVDAPNWQDWLKKFAAAIRALARQHPGAFQLFHRGSAQGELAMQSLESAIATFRSDGFDAVTTYCAISTVNVAVLGLALDEMGEHLRPAAREQLGQLPKDQFPHIHEVLACNDETDRFQYLLDVLIKGIAATRNP